MPATVPRSDAALPSLLDNPGRSVLVVNPNITTLNTAVESWSELDLLFFGIDREWRRLSMADLGLSDSLIYGDTFGSGELSSDGRWWAGPSRAGIIVLDLTTRRTHIIRTPHPGTWIRGQHAILSSGGLEISVPSGTVNRVPYTSSGVGYEPDGTPVSLIRDADGQAALVEWLGNSYSLRTAIPGATPPRQVKPPGARRIFRASELTGVEATEEQIATKVLHGRNRLTVIAADSANGDTIGEVTWDLRELSLTYTDTWLDAQTLLIAAAPYFVAWRPSTGELFRVTDARSLSDRYWTISSAEDATAP